MGVRPTPYLAVVRRGEEGVYRALRESLGRAEGVRVMWDRRQADRRVERQAVPSDRRRQERRAPPRLTWTAIGFVLAPVEPPPGGRRPA